MQEVARRQVGRRLLLIVGELADRIEHPGEMGGHRLVRDTGHHRQMVRIMRRADAEQRFAAVEPAPADDLGDAVLAAVDVPVMSVDAAVPVAGLEEGGVVAEEVGEDLVDRRHGQGQVGFFGAGQAIALPDVAAERLVLGRQVDEHLREEASVGHEALADDFGGDGVER